MNDKTLNYLETAQVDYRHCHKCLLACVIPDCYWRGRKEDFVGGLCPNHLEKENRWQNFHWTIVMGEEQEEEFPQSSTFLCARCRVQIIIFFRFWEAKYFSFMCEECYLKVRLTCQDCKQDFTVGSGFHIKSSVCEECHYKKKMFVNYRQSKETASARLVGAVLGVTVAVGAMGLWSVCQSNNKKRKA